MPNQATPNTRMRTHSRAVGFTQRRPISNSASRPAPTNRRPSASGPPEKYGATPRMTMNALDQASTVTTMAISTIVGALVALGRFGFVVVTRSRYPVPPTPIDDGLLSGTESSKAGRKLSRVLLVAPGEPVADRREVVRRMAQLDREQACSKIDQLLRIRHRGLVAQLRGDLDLGGVTADRLAMPGQDAELAFQGRCIREAVP